MVYLRNRIDVVGNDSDPMTDQVYVYLLVLLVCHHSSTIVIRINYLARLTSQYDEYSVRFVLVYPHNRVFAIKTADWGQ